METVSPKPVHLSTEAIEAGLEGIRQAPADVGVVELIVRRPAVDEREVRAIMTAAEKEGLVADSRSLKMIEFALKHGPNPEAREVWYMYANELKNTLSARELAEFRQDLLDHARSIAAISGGFLNIAFTISPNERRVLDQIEKALTV